MSGRTSKFDGTNASFNAFLDEFQSESDRATAILGAAFLDSILGNLILASVRDANAARDRLLGNSRPLGPFSARIDAAHAFHLVADEDAADLHVVRRIRNEFAHGLHGLHFGHDAVRDLCSNFHGLRALIEGDPERWADVDAPKDRFILGVALLAGNLQRLCDRARPLVPPLSTGEDHYEKRARHVKTNAGEHTASRRKSRRGKK